MDNLEMVNKICKYNFQRMCVSYSSVEKRMKSKFERHSQKENFAFKMNVNKLCIR